LHGKNTHFLWLTVWLCFLRGRQTTFLSLVKFRRGRDDVLFYHKWHFKFTDNKLFTE
jgi:hypothetical protein